MVNKVLLLIIIFLTICSVSFAEQATGQIQMPKDNIPEVEKNAMATSDKPRFDIGAGYWWTWASLDTKLVAISDLPGSWLKGDKISQLEYDTDAGLFVVNADAYLFWRIYMDGYLALGNMHDASQIDSDWQMQVSTSKWMESKASAEGDVRTWNANLYLRLLEEKENKGFFDISLGYLYYQDDISTMKDLVYRIWEWQAVNEPVDGLDSSDKYTFDGIRLGARARIRIHDRVAIKLYGGLSPWLTADRDGYWNLRQMDIKGTADATSYDLGISVEFKVVEHLFIEAGYKYMSFTTDTGDYTHTVDGVKYEFEDGWDSTSADRSGFYAMGRLKI